MRFLLDQDVYAVTIRLLRGLGHDVVPVAQIGCSQAPDSDLLRTAEEQSRVFVTREWDGTNWIERNAPSSPPAIFGPAMTYDGARGFTVLFDGECDYPCQRTWEYGLYRWWFPLVLF